MMTQANIIGYSEILAPVQDSNRAAVVHIRCLKEAEPRQLVDTLVDHRWENPNFCNDNIREFHHYLESRSTFDFDYKLSYSACTF